MTLPLVVVVWRDANTGGEDAIDLETVDSYHKPTIVTTIGWLLKQTDSGVTLVNEYYDSVYRGRTFILAETIQSVTPYKLSKPRKVASNETSPAV